MILFFISIIVIIYIFKINNFKKEAYYKITKKSYFKVRYNIGRYGEYLTYKYLKKFEDKGAKFLFNIYVPKKEKETSEIDVLMISPKGLFVFESKNYSGWIFGSDTQKYWYQTLPVGRGKSHKEKFYSPVFQNNTHIKYIKCLIGDQIPIYSIVTFSDRCTLKSVNIQSSKVNVINRYQVYNLISSIYNNTEDQIDNIQIENIYNTLYPYTQVDESIKQKHIEDIYNKTYSHNINSINDSENNDEIFVFKKDSKADETSVDNFKLDTMIDNSDINDDLKDRLIEFRKNRSNKMNIPAFYVFTNEELEKLVETRPKTIEQLKALNILSPIKIKIHGEQIILEINRK